MKKYILTIITVIMTNMANSQIPVSFKLLDKELNDIEGAKFEVNGKLLSYDSVQKHYTYNMIRHLDAYGKIKIRITHPDFEILEYDSISPSNHTLYLLKKGDIYYYDGEVKVASMNTRNKLLIRIKSEEGISKEDPKYCQTMKESLEEIIAPMSLKLIYIYCENNEYTEFEQSKFVGEKGKMVTKRNHSMDEFFIVGRVDGKEFPEFECVELGKLRSHVKIIYAGHFFVNNNEYKNPTVYFYNGINITVNVENSDSVLSILKQNDIGITSVVEAYGKLIIELKLDITLGLGINYLIERLMAEKIIGKEFRIMAHTYN